MNARKMRGLIAAIVIGLGGMLFAGYVASAYEWPIFEAGWTLLEDRTPDIDDPLFDLDLDRAELRLPEVESWGMR